MKPSRLITWAASAALATALSACGGGGEQGPDWAQTNKTLLSAPDGAIEPSRKFAPGTYFSVCRFISYVDPVVARTLEASEVINYTWVETPTGIQLQTTHTIYDNAECTDSGNSVLLKITEPLATVTRAGKITLRGLDRDGSGQVVVSETALNWVGERVLIETDGGLLTLSLSNGAVQAPDEEVTDPDTDEVTTVKVIKDRLGNVIFRQSIEFGASSLKDSLTVQNGVLYRGVVDNFFEDSFDELDYPRYVSAADPFTKR